MQDQASVTELWTKKDVIERTKFCERSVNYWLERGELPYIKIGRGVRFIPADVEAFIKSHRIGGK